MVHLHFMGLVSFEILVLIAALFLYAYISKQGMAKVYRYFAGTIAIVMIFVVVMTGLHHSKHAHGHGGHECSEECDHHKDGHHGSGKHGMKGMQHGHGDGSGRSKRIEKKVKIDEDGNRTVEKEVYMDGEKMSNHMTTTNSPHSFDETVAKLKEVIEGKGLKVMNTINHSEAAAAAEMELRPTAVVVFGNPKVGTLLMQADQNIGIDLPLKILVSEDSDGNVNVSYKEIKDVAAEFSIDQGHEVLNKVTGAMAGIVAEATGA